VVDDGAPAAPVPIDGECTAAGCVTLLEVALRHRELLTIERVSEGDPVTLFVRGTAIGRKGRDRIDLAKRLLDPGQPFTFAAPHSGFFTVWLVASRRSQVTVRASIASPP
jgi:hypothetical protein